MMRIIILIIAVTAGSLAAWLALSVQSGGASVAQQPLPPAPKVRMADVLVASSDISQGQLVSSGNLRWQSWPESAVNESFITQSTKPDAIEAFSGHMARSQFVAGEPIRESKLARTSAGMLAAMLPAGKRAVAIPISAESTAGGFILPNDRVDVIQTFTRQTDSGTESSSRTLLTNIRVLAVDQKADDTKEQATVIGKTATLELSSAQAEVVVAGQASSTLSLALRSVADNDDEQMVNRGGSLAVRMVRGGRSEIVKLR